jgi:predicted AAA+ superfamily ATPase
MARSTRPAFNGGFRAPAIVDEAQLCPEIFTAVQHLYDEDKRRWRFILCDSSARKLRGIGADLLPGRSLYHRLHPLVQAEIAPGLDASSLLPAPDWAEPVKAPFPAADIVERLSYGALPGIAAAPTEDRAALLRSYAPSAWFSRRSQESRTGRIHRLPLRPSDGARPANTRHPMVDAVASGPIRGLG